MEKIYIMKISLHKSAGLVLIILGGLHLHYYFTGPGPADLDILASMQAYEINIMGSHNLLQFHSGFSVMMGIMLMIYGGLIWLTDQSEGIKVSRNTRIFNIVSCLVLSFISFVYFHPLAYGFCLLAALLLALSFYKTSRK